VKAITIRQPWATLIALGVKTFETRAWVPRNERGEQYTGLVAIHAGRSYARWRDDALTEYRVIRALRFHGLLDANALPLGRIVSVCELGVARRAADVERELALDDDDRRFGEWTGDRRMAWPLRPVLRVYTAEVLAGQLGLWDLPSDVSRRLTAALARQERALGRLAG
jgi:hypothetical protein